MADQDIGSNPIRDLAWRFLVTFFLGVVIYRLGIYVPIPDVSREAMEAIVKNATNSEFGAILVWANMFNGSGISQGSIFGLGIMPYISASIILQLLTFSIPSLKALQRDGESGRRKINQYTRYLTLILALVQSCIASVILLKLDPARLSDGSSLPIVVAESSALFIFQSTIIITTGCMFVLWIAEQITKFGIGNGVSIIIMIGIVAGAPGALSQIEPDMSIWLFVIAAGLAVIAAIVIVVQSLRKVNLEQQRRIQGNRVMGGGQTSLPIKLNQANVIPVIFASPVIMVLVAALGGLDNLYFHWFESKLGIQQLFDMGGTLHRYVFAGLIIAFTFFYISITFDLNEMANHFKQAGFFLRGIKPGKNTVDHLRWILMRVTVVGALFLAIIAILPEILSVLVGADPNKGSALLMQGTGLMIVVGVVIDVMQKVASFLLAQKYQGISGLTSVKSGKRF